MTGDHWLSKVQILIQQSKHKEAETMLADLLREYPNDIHYLSLLAEVKLQLDEFDHANKIIETAIGLSPDSAHLFYIQSRIALQQEKIADAEKHILQAIQTDPYDADYFALLAHIQLHRKLYTEALETANKALEIDAENLLALNTRSTALNKLNRSEESFQTIEGALREDPNNAYTHANYGWGLLEKGDYKKAKEHFSEALLNNPNSQYAQSGMLESIKATNPIYRLFLKYAFWMGNLTAQYQWVVILGFYFGFKGLRKLASSNPSLQPYLTPLIILLAMIAFSTWIIRPISNLFLRFNKYGKLLLTKEEKMSANIVAVCLVLFIAGILLYFGLSDQKMLSIAVFGFAMMLPSGTMLSPSKNKIVLIVYTIILAAIGIIAIAQTFSTGEIFTTMSAIFILGFVAFQWVANYMLIKQDNH